MLARLTGASRLVVLGPTLRKQSNLLPFRRPFHRVHSDFTDKNGPETARRALTVRNSLGRVTSKTVTEEDAEAVLKRRYAE